ncbi:MAG: peptidyl-tRNA hydrolase [Planctomycetota bacterium]
MQHGETSCAIDSQPKRHNPITHYIVVRPDLPRGLLAAQVTHAAGESSTGNLNPGTYAVVLQADAQALLELEQLLRDQCVPHRAIRESDPPYEGALMAIGLEPCRRKEVERHVSSLPLLR